MELLFVVADGCCSGECAEYPRSHDGRVGIGVPHPGFPLAQEVSSSSLSCESSVQNIDPPWPMAE